jgi:uncharacterized membrane protein
MNCTNCGRELVERAKFCAECGSPVVTEQGSVDAKIQDAPTSTEMQENKVIFVLSYLGVLFFLPLVSCPNSKAGRFHANQGLVLLLTAIAGQIAIAILSSIILAISWRLWAITSLLSTTWATAMLVLMIIGMMNANRGLQKPLPIIGEVTILS